jgi:hypothetical protein
LSFRDLEWQFGQLGAELVSGGHYVKGSDLLKDKWESVTYASPGGSLGRNQSAGAFLQAPHAQYRRHEEWPHPYRKTSVSSSPHRYQYSRDMEVIASPSAEILLVLR